VRTWRGVSLAGASPVEAVRLPAGVSAASTVVEHVYPSTDLLPDNQLKFYLHFPRQ
jgi:hypothetical protein